MLPLLQSVKSLFQRKRIVTDNHIFRLHTILTVILLVLFSSLVTMTQFFGDPIVCTGSEGILPDRYVNVFCWIHTTYTFRNVSPDVPMPYPGIASKVGNAVKHHHKYYQWVYFVLMLQAAMFYIPRHLWKQWESGKIKALVFDAELSMFDDKSKNEKLNDVVEYLVTHIQRHRWYVAKYLFCELLCLVNVVGQLFIMDKFFDDEFVKYGLEVVRFLDRGESERTDPMIRIFPRVAKCNVYKFGYSGTILKMDTICLLPINIVNEKIYIFLWFWCIILTTATAALILHRMALVLLPRFRLFCIVSRFRAMDRDAFQEMVSRGSLGSWFLLYMIGQNLRSDDFRLLLAKLKSRFVVKV